MGRYKRHQKHKSIEPSVNLTVTTTLSTLERNNDNKRKQLLSPNSTNLIKSLLTSVKKRGKYANFATWYSLDKKTLEDPQHSIPYMRVRLPIGNQLSIRVDNRGIDFYKSFLGRLWLIDEFLGNSHARIIIGHRYNKMMSMLRKPLKSEILEYYAKDEIERLNIKVYPNELVFKTLFGTIFAIIGLFSILIILYYIGGVFICALYSLFVFITLNDMILTIKKD